MPTKATCPRKPADAPIRRGQGSATRIPRGTAVREGRSKSAHLRLGPTESLLYNMPAQQRGGGGRAGWRSRVRSEPGRRDERQHGPWVLMHSFCRIGVFETCICDTRASGGAKPSAAQRLKRESRPRQPGRVVRVNGGIRCVYHCIFSVAGKGAFQSCLVAAGTDSPADRSR